MKGRSLLIAGCLVLAGCGAQPTGHELSASYRTNGEPAPIPVPSLTPSQSVKLKGFWEIRPSCRTFTLSQEGQNWTVSVNQLSPGEAGLSGSFDGTTLFLHTYDRVLDRTTDYRGKVNKNGTISGTSTVYKTVIVSANGVVTPTKTILSTASFYAYRDGTVVLP